MRLGFLIDQRKCIGCHACTVACKAEHDVPLGVNRTWVQYVERGEFPNTRRFFQVNRCNHCDNAPCVAICPTGALFRRENGIVDFDNSKCIGCKACMEACPYDAIYIDPQEHTAAKCNFCAHRVEEGLLPACVVVCPEEAIVTGDLDDPSTLIAQLVAREPVQVRKPEQGTRPHVFYIGADEATLNPLQSASVGAYMWADQPDAPGIVEEEPRRDHAQAVKVYDVPHVRRPWGWMVSAYLWTKSVSAGAAILAGLSALLAAGLPRALTDVVNPLLALLFLGATLLLLVGDLKRPGRFWRLLLRPHLTSWLVWGGYILTAFGLFTTVWLLLGIFSGVPPGPAPAVILVALGAAAAAYSAFLFGQAEGRDFWQNPLVFWHLLVQAGIAAAALGAIEAYLLHLTAQVWPLAGALLALLALHGLFTGAEMVLPHASREVELAAHAVTHGALRRTFWGIAVLPGLVLPLLLAALAILAQTPALLPVAAALALAGLAAYEHVWVQAGQIVPLT